MAAINFKTFFDKWVAATEKTWGHDRSKSLGASEAFGCHRKAWFGKNGAPVDPDYEQSWGALRRGDAVENAFVAPAMTWAMENLTTDATLIWAGENQKTLIHEHLSATPDGLVIYADDDALAEYGVPSLGGSKKDVEHPSNCFNLEIKSVDPRVNLKEEKAIHRGQTIVQMGLTRMKTKWRPNYAVIIYIDASFFDDIEVFIVPYDQRTFEVAQLRARQVFQTKNPADIMAEGKIEGDCAYCKFKIACAKVNKEATPTKGEGNRGNLPLALQEEFERLVRAERVAQSAKKAAETEHKSASEKLKQWFSDTGVRVADLGDVKASISWIKGRKTLQKSLLLAAGIDPDDYSTEGEGHSRLNISEKGSTKADSDDADR